MDLGQRTLITRYVDLLLRYKVFIILLLLFSLPIGLVVYLKTPKLYKASSLLSYQQQKITGTKMTTDVGSRTREMVSTLTQIVTSRSNLEKLIGDLKLYPEALQNQPMEDVVEMMGRAIKIEPSAQGETFRISYIHKNRDLVVKVTNALAARFIEENLKYREEKATETTAFTSNELEKARAAMDSKENAMRDYKLRYFNELPEQRESNVGRLIALQKQNQEWQMSIQDLERTAVLITDQIDNRRKVLESEAQISAMSEVAGSSQMKEVPQSSEARLAKAEQLLDQILSRYTEKHPEVKRLRTIIARLKEEVERDRQLSGKSAGNRGSGASQGGDRSADRHSTDNVILQLETQRKNVLRNIEAIKEEREKQKSVIAQYEKWVAAAPIREAEWATLTREYGQYKRHYDYLITQDLEAKSMLNLERRQKGSQFNIEDPARTPEKPIQPDFIKIMGIAIAAGLGLGLGISFFLDFFDGTVRDPELVETALGLTLLTTIPYLETEAERKRRRLRIVLTTLVLIVVAGGVVALFAVAWMKGYVVL
jgi:polysaccharide chain length determinant protein (PEP-CTERM system associated)